MLKRSLPLFCILAFFALPQLAPRAKAMDPVTIAILAPIAIKGAQVAAPYVMRGLQSGAVHLMTMGGDLLETFSLPLGTVQATLGVPFGQLGPGVGNLVKGGIAPFKLAWHTLMLPLAFCGVGVSGS